MYVALVCKAANKSEVNFRLNKELTFHCIFLVSFFPYHSYMDPHTSSIHKQLIDNDFWTSIIRNKGSLLLVGMDATACDDVTSTGHEEIVLVSLSTKDRVLLVVGITSIVLSVEVITKGQRDGLRSPASLTLVWPLAANVCTSYAVERFFLSMTCNNLAIAQCCAIKDPNRRERASTSIIIL